MVHHRKWSISMWFYIGQKSIFVKEDKLHLSVNIRYLNNLFTI